MAHKGASVGRGLPGDGAVWDEDFAPEAFAEFDFPRRRITNGKGRTTNGNGRVANGNGNGNGNGHRAPAPYVSPPSNPRQPASSSGPGQGVPGRRTVTIRGYGAERNLPRTA